MKKFRNLAIFLFFAMGLSILIAGSLFNYYLSPVSRDIININVIITDGHDINDITDSLYKKKLIRNPKVFKIYLSISGIDEFNEGSFDLKPNMSSKEIIKYLSTDE